MLLTLLEPVITRADAEFDGAVQRLPTDPRRVWRNGIKAFFTAFSSHRAVARAAHGGAGDQPGVPGDVVELHAEVDRQDRGHDQRRTGARCSTRDHPAADLATSLNQMNERTMMAALSAEQPAVSEDHVVDTLTHIWVSSIYGEAR